MRARLVSRPVLFLALLTLSCSTTRSALVNLWIDPGHEAKPAGHVMVVALWRDPDARSLWEERFAQALGKNKADATPSYLELSAPMPDSAAVFKRARSRDCDAVVVIHEHIMDDGSFYVPGYTRPARMKIPRWYRPSGGTEAWMDDYSSAGWPTLHCDVELWSPGDPAGMVWSGTSEVVDPGTDDNAASEVANRVVNELARLGLVPGGL